MRNTKFIGITGSSGSGKSTVAEELANHYAERNIECEVISLDDFYRDGLDQNTTNWDHPNAFDHERFAQFLHDLKAQETAEYPKYNFTTSSREIETNRTRIGTKLFIFEGIFAHHPDVSHLYHATIFVHTNLSLCFERRKARDMAMRGQTEMQVTKAWSEFVLPMYHEHISPKLEQAHIVVANDENHQGLHFDMTQLIESLNARLRGEKNILLSQMRYNLLPRSAKTVSHEAAVNSPTVSF